MIAKKINNSDGDDGSDSGSDGDNVCFRGHLGLIGKSTRNSNSKSDSDRNRNGNRDSKVREIAKAAMCASAATLASRARPGGPVRGAGDNIYIYI